MNCDDWRSGTLNVNEQHYYVFTGNDLTININACNANFASQLHVYHYNPINQTIQGSYFMNGSKNYAECGNHFKGSFLNNIQIQNGQSIIFSISNTDSDIGYYDLSISCGYRSAPDPWEPRNIEGSIGCNETIKGFHECCSDNDIWIEITSSALNEAGNILNGCGSDYRQRVRIWDSWGYTATDQSVWNPQCNDDSGYLEWYNWDDTMRYYLQIRAEESGYYSISMECGITTTTITNLSIIGCNETVKGFHDVNESTLYQIIDSQESYNNGATIFDGSQSDYDQILMIYNQYDVLQAMYYPTLSLVNTSYIEWYHWSDDPEQKNLDYYLVVAGYEDETGNYSITMQCNEATSQYEQVVYCGDSVSQSLRAEGQTYSYQLMIPYTDVVEYGSKYGSAYIMTDCNQQTDITMIAYDSSGRKWQYYGNEKWDWECQKWKDYLIINLWSAPFNETLTYDLKVKLSKFDLYQYYNFSFNVFCGHQPKGPIDGTISCGDENIVGSTDSANLNKVYYNFNNPKDQDVTFRSCSMSNHINSFRLYDTDWSWISFKKFGSDDMGCTYWTRNVLSAGNYIFGVARVAPWEWEETLFLLDVMCDTDYTTPLIPEKKDVMDKSCNCIFREDGIVPVDVCFGSNDEKITGKKYICLNDSIVASLHYNTSNCDSPPTEWEIYNSSTAEFEYICNASVSCPYVMTTYYPMIYDFNINEYICSPNTSKWQSFPQVMDVCLLRDNHGFTSSIQTFHGGNLTESFYLGYDCGATGNINNQYLYDETSIQSHDCCNDPSGDVNGCEQMSDGGTYVVIEQYIWISVNESVKISTSTSPPISTTLITTSTTTTTPPSSTTLTPTSITTLTTSSTSTSISNTLTSPAISTLSSTSTSISSVTTTLTSPSTSIVTSSATPDTTSTKHGTSLNTTTTSSIANEKQNSTTKEPVTSISTSIISTPPTSTSTSTARSVIMKKFNESSTTQKTDDDDIGTTSLMVNTADNKAKLLITLVITFVVIIENEIF